MPNEINSPIGLNNERAPSSCLQLCAIEFALLTLDSVAQTTQFNRSFSKTVPIATDDMSFGGEVLRGYDSVYLEVDATSRQSRLNQNTCKVEQCLLWSLLADPK